jgi:hypothetical protein
MLDALPAEVAVLEAGSEVVPSRRWRTSRVRRYGGTVVTVAVANGPPVTE